MKTIRYLTAGLIAAGMVASSSATTIVTNGLVAYYPFHGDANDASGNGNNGSVVGASFQTNGLNDTVALTFAGNTSSYVVVPESGSLEPSNGLSIAMWCNGVPGDACGDGWGTILRKSANCQPGYLIRGCNGGTSYQLDGPNVCSGGPLVTAGFLTFTGTNWQHIVGTYSVSDGMVKSYENGVLINETPYSTLLSHSGNLYIGGANVAGDDGGFSGSINEVRIYNRELSAAEVQELFNTTNGAPPVASFSGSPTNGCAPLTVTYTDTSTGSITNWSWNFGDGGTTNLATNSVVYTYNTGGVYTVSEIVTGPGGAGTNVQPNYIVVVNCPMISAITKEGNNVRVTWTCFGGQSNALQSTKSTAMIAEYTTNFTDISPTIIVSGLGQSMTNYLDVGAAYAPVLTAPGGTIVTTSTVSSTVSISATGTRGITDSLGNALPIGSVLMLGTFSISEPTIQSNFTAGNVTAIMSAFTPYTNSFAVGDGTSLPASWDVSRSAAGFGGQQIYLLAIDKPTLAAATDLGIYTAPSWTFPTGGGTNTIDLADVTDFVIGALGGPLTINLPLGGETYTFNDTAKLSVMPGRILFYRVRLAQ
jgi:PKD repeat protein